jgi:cyanate permease
MRRQHRIALHTSLLVRVLSASAFAGAMIGSLLLVDGHEWAGTLAIVATFALCILTVYRPEGPERQGASQLDEPAIAAIGS